MGPTFFVNIQLIPYFKCIFYNAKHFLQSIRIFKTVAQLYGPLAKEGTILFQELRPIVEDTFPTIAPIK